MTREITPRLRAEAKNRMMPMSKNERFISESYNTEHDCYEVLTNCGGKLYKRRYYFATRTAGGDFA